MYLMKCNGSRVAHFPNFMPGHVHNHMIVHTLSAKVYSQHSWAQRKLSPLSPLNILLTINGPLLS